MPEDNLVPHKLVHNKKLLRGMCFLVDKIDCCPNSCMIYWRDDIEFDLCKFYSISRFKENRRSMSSE